jgi:hypothetical protein
VAGLRRSRRRRRMRKPTVIDFDNRLLSVNDGVLHINPAVLEQTKELFKILDNGWPMEEQTSPRVVVRAPVDVAMPLTQIGSLAQIGSMEW